MMDDDMEDEIICEIITTHAHIFWRYIGLTSNRVFNFILLGTGDSSKSKMFKPGPYVAVFCLAILFSYLLQNGSHLIRNYMNHINKVLGIEKVVKVGSLKSFVSSTINSDNVSEEFRDGIAGVYAMQGRRGYMEDRFSIYQDVKISNDKKMSFFGVYDGHGGQFVAEYVKEHLFNLTIEKLKSLYSDAKPPPSPEKKETNNNSYQRKSSVSAVKNLQRKPSTTKEQETTEESCESETKTNCITGSVVNGRRPSAEMKTNLLNKMNEEINDDSNDKEKGSGVQDINESSNEIPMKKDDIYSSKNLNAKRHSISQKENAQPEKEVSEESIYFDSHKNINYTRLLTDQILAVDSKIVDYCKTNIDMSGSTAVVAVLDGEMLVIGNVGDSRAVMGDIRGTTVPLSFDHKPNQLKERRRIKEAGGFITFAGVWRVAGILATSRALGDFPLKDPRKLVTAEPDVLTFSLKEHKAQFVILATDGLWDVMSNEEAVNFIRERLDEYDFGARSLALHAYNLGSQDNITITVLNLSKLAI